MPKEVSCYGYTLSGVWPDTYHLYTRGIVYGSVGVCGR